MAYSQPVNSMLTIIDMHGYGAVVTGKTQPLACVAAPDCCGRGLLRLTTPHKGRVCPHITPHHEEHMDFAMPSPSRLHVYSSTVEAFERGGSGLASLLHVARRNAA